VVRMSEVHESSVGVGRAVNESLRVKQILDAEYAVHEVLMLYQGGCG
jgi:hypothetical protein